MTWKCHTSPTSVGLPFPWIVYIPCRTLWPMKVAPSIVRQGYSCLFLELYAGFAQLWKQYTCLWGQAIKPGTETVKRKRNETKRNETGNHALYIYHRSTRSAGHLKKGHFLHMRILIDGLTSCSSWPWVLPCCGHVALQGSSGEWEREWGRSSSFHWYLLNRRLQ